MTMADMMVHVMVVLLAVYWEFLMVVGLEK
jgi:hypothetical protein